MSEFTEKITELMSGAFCTPERAREVHEAAAKLDAIEGPMGGTVRSHFVAWVHGYGFAKEVPAEDAHLPETVILGDVDLAKETGLTSKQSIQQQQDIRAAARVRRIDRAAYTLEHGHRKDALCMVCSKEEWRQAQYRAGIRGAA